MIFKRQLVKRQIELFLIEINSFILNEIVPCTTYKKSMIKFKVVMIIINLWLDTLKVKLNREFSIVLNVECTFKS